MNKFIPSLGFILVLLMFLGSYLFIKWVYLPFEFERSWQYEKQGHLAYKNKNYLQAYKYFLESAQLEDHNNTKSYKYRCAGSALQQLKQYENALNLFNMSLKYNKNNKLATSTIQWMRDTKKIKSFVDTITYSKRSLDGWSLGNMSSSTLNVINKTSNYSLTYFTSNPKNSTYKIKIILDDKIIVKEEILKGIINEYIFSLEKGKHILQVLINKTFNPMKLGMNKDNRNLGIHFEIKKTGEQ